MNHFHRLTVISLVCALALTMLAGCANNADGSDDEAEFEKITEVIDSIQELKASDEFLDADIDTQTELVMQELEKHEKEGRIKADTILCDEEEHVITFEYSDGTLGCDLVGGFEEGLDYYTLNPSSLIQYDETYPAQGNGQTADAIILNAMTDRSDVNARCEALAAEWSGSGINTTIDNTVTLDDLSNLKGYEFVYVKMHGGYMPFTFFGKSVPVIFLEQKADLKTKKQYKEDKKNHCVGIKTDGHYFVSSEFFTAHYGTDDLSGSIFFLGCCQLMGRYGQENKNWTKALNAVGVAAFVGFMESNYTDYNLDLVDAFMDSLIAGKTAKEAFDTATAAYGSTNWEWCELKNASKSEITIDAYPMLKGDKDSTLKWEGTAEATPTATPTPTPTPVTIDTEVLYAAYCEVLYSYESDLRTIENDPVRDLKSCALTDLTGDGYPELIILYQADETYGVDESSFSGDYVYADLRIFTMIPGENTATEMLYVSEVVAYDIISDVVVLNNGNILVEYSNFTGTDYSFTEYSLDGYSFIQANKLDEVFYPDETGEDGETVYSYNGDTITYDEYTSKIDNLAGMISGRFVMSQYVFWRSEYWSDAVLNAQDYSISLDEASAILGYSPVTEANPEVTGTTEPDNSYYVNELAGWWVKFGGLGGPVNYVYSFGMNSMDKYIYNDDGTYTFDSSVPVTYETTANEGIIIYITDTDTYYILNDEGDLEFQWGDNGYSGSDSLGRVE